MTLSVRITKRLPRFTLQVDLELPGEGIHAVVGPSGAGKTSLLRLLAGLDKPDGGSIRLGDATWSDTARGVHLEPWQRPVGMVFQDFGLFPHLNLLDNVLFANPGRFHAEALMRSLDVWQLRFARPDRVSGGERQRCAICQALARQPRLLLLDEPFSALDPVTRRALGGLLRQCAGTLKIPVVLVTHDMEEGLSLADSVVTLVDGRVAGEWLDRRLEEMQRDLERNQALFARCRAERRFGACS